MNIWNSWNYFFKRVFSKLGTWIILFLWFALATLFITMSQKDGWFLGMQKVECVNEERNRGGYSEQKGHSITNPKINNVNDFFACIFPNLIIFPLVVWIYVFCPISWLFWGQFDDVGQKTQKDGTDLFFLSTEIPTNRKKIFWGKFLFITSFLSILYLILFALPFSLLLWKSNYFGNFTGLDTLFFLGWNFLISPLLFFLPLVILLFSLASLNSIWYTILKWFGRLSVIFILIFVNVIFRSLSGGSWGKKYLNDEQKSPID